LVEAVEKRRLEKKVSEFGGGDFEVAGECYVLVYPITNNSFRLPQPPPKS
jgi:hypothetical protein